jgi:AcrR family transcriptional regulator
MFHTRIPEGASMSPRPATKPRKRASQQRSRATVDALIEATARILVSEGFDKASTNRIAEVAGVSVGSLYQYFPSKEALTLAVAERHNRAIMKVVGGTLAELPSLDVEQAIRSLVAVAIEAHRVDPDLHRVIAEQIPRIGPLEDLAGAHLEAQARFKSYLENHREELRVADVGLAAYICATSIEAVAHNAVLHHADKFADDSAQRLIDETAQLLLRYLKQV